MPGCRRTFFVKCAPYHEFQGVQNADMIFPAPLDTFDIPLKAEGLSKVDHGIMVTNSYG